MHCDDREVNYYGENPDRAAIDIAIDEVSFHGYKSREGM